MKTVIYLLTALFIAVGSAVYLHQAIFSDDNPGYVIIGNKDWVMETSLYFLTFILVFTFALLYILLRLISHAIRLPRKILNRGDTKKSTRSQQALISGLIDSAEGNWERAEKSLIRHAANSGMPLVHYLTAAKAAQSRGAFSKRDEYLRLAHESPDSSELAVGLTEAELHLSDNQFDKAMESLTALQSIAPTHAKVLSLLHQTYEHLGDWEGLRKLIPSLHKNKVLMEAELKLLETETYSALIKEHSESKDLDALRTLWDDIPDHTKKMSGMHAVFYAAMIDAGAGNEIEDGVLKLLSKEWNETLVVLYGCIKSQNPSKQLSRAERWLSKHPRDAILLRMLGKLCIRNQEFAKAEKYLAASVGIEPSVDAFLLLGDMFAEQNDTNRASECFRRGLLLASDEVVKQIDDMQVDFDDVQEATG